MTIWRCSFCGQTHTHAWMLITGPGVNICSDCVIQCNAVLTDRLASGADPWEQAAWLSELVAALDRLRARAAIALNTSLGEEITPQRKLLLDELTRSLEELLGAARAAAPAEGGEQARRIDALEADSSGAGQ